MIIYDGKSYETQNDIPDLGSWECVKVEGCRRDYCGFSADVSKLPHYSDLGTGSVAMCLDTGDLYVYHAPTGTWYLQ